MTWTERRTSVLSLRDAMALGDIIKACRGERAVWLDDHNEPKYGTVRHIVRDPETAGFLRADEDVRDAWLRITTDSRFEWFVPICDVVERMRREEMFFQPMKRPCHFCADIVDDQAKGSMLRVTGWAENRDQGGTNALRGRRPTGEVAHKSCVDAALQGFRDVSMFDDE